MVSLFKLLHSRPSIPGIALGLLLLDKTRHTSSCQLQRGRCFVSQPLSPVGASSITLAPVQGTCDALDSQSTTCLKGQA